VLILGRLHAGACSVNELAMAVEIVGELLEQAISHVEHVRGGLARTTSADHLAEV